MKRLMGRLAEPYVSSLFVGAALVLTGFVCFAMGMRGVDETRDVPIQLPFLISGGLAGIGLIGLGLALFSIQTARLESSLERDEFDSLLQEAQGVAALIRS